MKANISIAWGLPLIILSGFLLVTVLSGIVTYTNQMDFFFAARTSEARERTSLTQTLFEQTFTHEGLRELQDWTLYLAAIGNVESVNVLNGDGRIVCSSERGLIGRAYSPDLAGLEGTTRVTLTNTAPVRVNVDRDREKLFTYSRFCDLSEQRRGCLTLLEVEALGPALDAQLVAIKNRVAIEILGTFVIAIALLIFMRAVLTEPLNHIITTLRRFSIDREGEVQLTGLSGNNEIGQLGRSVDSALTSIRTAAARARAVFEHSTIGEIVFDENGTILEVNESALAMFGWRREHLIGKPIETLMPPSSTAGVELLLAYTGAEAEEAHSQELLAKRIDGHHFPVHIGIAQVEVDGHLQFIASVLDLTVERGLQTQLRQSQKMEAIGQLSGGIAHDFNNLLGIVLGNVELAQRKVEPESRVATLLENAHKAAARGAGLTRRLLNFSRQEATSQEITQANEVVGSLKELLARALPPDITMEVQLARELPPISVPRSDLEDALINLALNARDAMPEGGVLHLGTHERVVSPSSRLALQVPPGRYVEIKVSDTGTGMAREVAERIFEPFFSTKEKGKGTGLGLSLVYGFVKRSGGDIQVDSKLGRGTRFRLLFPATEAAAPVADSDDDSEASERNLRGTERLLIVDDEEDMLSILVEALGSLGYAVETANSGEAALARLSQRDKPIDLMLTDVLMPDMRGDALARRAQQDHPNLKICLSSGYTGTAVADQRKALAEFPLLRKPYLLAEVPAVLRRLLDDA